MKGLSGIGLSVFVVGFLGCSGDDGPPVDPDAGPGADAGPTCDPLAALATGGDGAADPLSVEAGKASAGRLELAEIPVDPMLRWKPGDFVLANEKVAMVIEDIGESDHFDVWGGKPIGLARVAGGALVDPSSNFGELYLLAGRTTLMTESVGVLNDGADGQPAVIRAVGKLKPLPPLDRLLRGVFSDTYDAFDVAFDYTLAPGADHVDVAMVFQSKTVKNEKVGSGIHAFLFAYRMPSFLQGLGFGANDETDWFAQVQDDGTGYAYMLPEGKLGLGLATSGFSSLLSDGVDLPACAETRHEHARIVIGGPDLDGLVEAVARTRGDTLRAIAGTVAYSGGDASTAGTRVHAETTAGVYLTRATVGDDGRFALHVPADADVRLIAYRAGEAVVTVDAAEAGDTAIVLPRPGTVQIDITEDGDRVPVRIQLLPTGGSTIPTVPASYGEPARNGGRLTVVYAMDGRATIEAPAGTWQVVASRGFEYELFRESITVTAGGTVNVTGQLVHSVETPGVQCADFHVHTHRSPDSGDDAAEKVMSAVSDGVELPVRSDHEWIDSFAELIEELGLGEWAAGIGSIELTSFETWGHMGVFPLEADRSKPNWGAPRWQTFPTPADPDLKVTTMSPKAVFDAVRGRPEAPVVIINHPRGNTNYFGYVGLDPVTGAVEREADWDTAFTLVEVFNGSDWRDNRDGTVTDWFTLLRNGRKVFAVGSSDSHSIASSPVGYPRTCVDLGVDLPAQATPDLVRDQLAAGHATVNGGIFVEATVLGAGPGDTATGVPDTVMVDITVRAATWIDVDGLDLVVDGVIVDPVPIMPEDADDEDPTIRWHGQLEVEVAATGSFVVVAAYGDDTLEPVHPGRRPFGVTNPIFLEP